MPIDNFDYRCGTSFHHLLIRDPNLHRTNTRENQWRVMVLEDFHTALLYQVTNTINIILWLYLNNTRSSLRKNNGVTFLYGWLL